MGANDNRTLKIELLGQWELEAEFRNLQNFTKNEKYIKNKIYGDLQKLEKL